PGPGPAPRSRPGLLDNVLDHLPKKLTDVPRRLPALPKRLPDVIPPRLGTPRSAAPADGAGDRSLLDFLLGP
ncbi:MAG: hypothetical protein M3296_09590, partial [Actinomycetota bacterium]|nr:hypothetical protein [Actinomycetota bacterium]